MIRKLTRQLGAALLALSPATATAQSLFDGDTLPKHTGGLIIGPGIGYGNGILERYGRGWQAGRESILQDFDGLDLARVIGGNEAQAETIKTILGGELGTTNFDAKQNSFAINFTAAFGITDRLTVAAIVPVQWVRYDLDAYLTYEGTDISEFRVADDPAAIQCPGGSFDLDDPNDLRRLGADQDNYRFNIGDLQRALTSQCFGYKPIFDRVEAGNDGLLHGRQTRTVSGFRDIALGAKYQFFKGRHLHLAALTYMVAGTGRPQDPEKLIDFKLGDGNWSTGLLVGATIPLGKFRIGLSAGYELELPDKERLRLPNVSFSDELETQLARGEITERELLDKHIDDANFVPLVTRFDVAETSRKLGDNIYVYGQFSYQLFEWLSIGATFNFLHHFRDRLTGIGARPENAPPYPTEAEVRAEVDRLLETPVEEGGITEEQKINELKARLGGTVERKKAAYGWRTTRGQLGVGLGLFFNTLPMFIRGEFPVPLLVGISASRFIAGQNIDTPDSVNMTITLPFAIGTVKDPAEWGYDDEGAGPPWP